MDNGELDRLELGDRVAVDLCFSEAGMGYTYLEDRWWAVVVQLYAAVVRVVNPVPPEWKPEMDEHGMWVHRRPVWIIR